MRFKPSCMIVFVLTVFFLSGGALQAESASDGGQGASAPKQIPIAPTTTKIVAPGHRDQGRVHRSIPKVSITTCGNGVRDAGEQCDQSPCGSGLVCKDCKCVPFPSPMCGDGKLDPGEECEKNIPCAEGTYCALSCKCMGK